MSRTAERPRRGGAPRRRRCGPPTPARERRRAVETGPGLRRPARPRHRRPGQGPAPRTSTSDPPRGEGTPLVAEFAPCRLAARLVSRPGRSPARRRRPRPGHRLPDHWAGVQAHQISQQHARYVARKTRQLSVEEAAYVDERIAALRRRAGLLDPVRGPPHRRDRRRRPRRGRGPRTRSRAQHLRQGHPLHRARHARVLRPRHRAAIARIDATVAYIADALLALGDHTPLDYRRAKAVLIMANPTQAVQILAAFGTLRDQHAAANNTAEAKSRDTPSSRRSSEDADPARARAPSRSGSTPPPQPAPPHWPTSPTSST